MAIATSAITAAPAVALRGPPDLSARAWLLVDARDGRRLAAHAPARALPIASTTKLMTVYIALEELPLDRKLTAPAYSPIPGESVLGLQEGERLTVRDLLVAMMLPSANDAAETVAVGAEGSERAFVNRMNAEADDLGLADTSYANPIGLDDPLNQSSAHDLTTLALALREDPRFRKIVSKPEATLRSGEVVRHVVSSNTLLSSDPSVDGVKTGHTPDAGYVLVASAERNGVPLLSVVIGAGSEAARDRTSEQLLDYGYSLYQRRAAVRRGAPLGAAAVRYEDGQLPLVAARPIPVFSRADQEVGTSLDVPAEVEGPLDQGERVGSVTVTLDGERVGRAPVLAARAVAAPGVIDRHGGLLAAALVLGGVIVILIGVVAALRRRGGVQPAGEVPNERTPEERMRSRDQRSRRDRRDGGPS